MCTVVLDPLKFCKFNEGEGNARLLNNTSEKGSEEIGVVIDPFLVRFRPGSRRYFSCRH